MIQVHSEGDGYVLKDDESYVYGRYTNKKKAEQAADDWNAYYAAPLVFTVTGSV